MTPEPFVAVRQSFAKRTRPLVCGLAFAVVIGAGCSGTVDSNPGTTGTPGSGSGSVSGTGNSGKPSGNSGTGAAAAGNNGQGGAAGDPVVASCTAVEPGRVTIHRLNVLEYNNTVRDLLGDTTHPADAFPSDTGGGNFDNNSDVLATSPLLYAKMDTAADALATAAVATGSAARAKIITCDSTKVGDATCANTVVTAFARKAWRRPATPAEVTRLAALVTLARTNGDTFDKGVSLAIKAILMSPNFTFRPELDPDAKATAPRLLNNYEMASRLSYFLWSSLPDDTLAAAADAGGLQDIASVQKQATRMLDDAKAATMVSNFAGQWFGTNRMASVTPLASAFPTFDATLASAMTQETNLFLRDFLADTNISFLDVLNAPWTYVNARLAQHYGLPAVSGTALQKVSLTGTKRAGLLTQGAFLTTTSFPTRTSPVKRGQWVLANVLCSPPPPPPDNVPALEKTVVPAGSSVRTQLNAHIADPNCSGCHSVMDPIGFAFEHFDGIGQWRETDGSAAIDSSGQLPDGTKFDGAQALETSLRQNASSISTCATRKVFSYALGRDPVSADQCQLNQLSASFKSANYNLRTLVMQMVASDTFRMRRPAAPGGL